MDEQKGVPFPRSVTCTDAELTLFKSEHECAETGVNSKRGCGQTVEIYTHGLSIRRENLGKINR